MQNHTERFRRHTGLQKENFNKARYKFALQILPSPNATNLKILELGSGLVEFARIIQSIGYNVYTLELDIEKIKYSKTLGFPSICADFNEFLPILKEKFDGIVMLEVIEHIMNAEKLLFESYRVLKPGGFLVLSTPNFSHYYNRLKVVLGKSPLAEGYHYRFFTKRIIFKLIQKAGFSVSKYVASSYIPLYNRLRKIMGLQEIFFVSPHFFSSLIGNTFYLLAKKENKIV